MGYSMKIELGCGQSKAAGYIGVDRFPMKGVDVVADLNQRFPFEDDSADVIWACHSLEHLKDIGFTMSEVFRVLRHGGLFLVLAPYYWQSVGIVNHYHIVPFTEELFRFYNQSKSTQLNDYPYYDDCPHASIYGLALSDNSDNRVNFEPLYQECFYYESFRGLPEAEKERARRNLLNVCDQFYIAVAANKSDESFSEETLDALQADARQLEPGIVAYIRERDSHWEYAKGSILSDVDAHIAAESDAVQEIIKDAAEKLSTVIAALERRNDERTQQTALELEQLGNCERLHTEQIAQLSNQDEQHTEQIAHLSAQGAQHAEQIPQLSAQCTWHAEQIVQLSAQCTWHVEQIAQLSAQCAKHAEQIIGLSAQGVQYVDQIAELSVQGARYTQQLTQLAKCVRRNETAVYEQARFQDRHRGILGKKLFRRRYDLSAGIKATCPQFIDGLAQQYPSLGKWQMLTYSSILPCEQAAIYQIKGGGMWLHLFVSGGGGADIAVTVKSNECILYEGVISSSIEGETVLPCPGAGETLYVEVRLLENRGVARLLEITCRKWFVFTRETLAAFCSD